MTRSILLWLLLIVGARVAGVHPQRPQRPQPPRLRVESFGSEARTFHVLSTLVSGPTEAVLWDGQYSPKDGARIADSIAARGKRLVAIVLSHADHDHYMGVLEIARRFPGTPILATPSVREDFARRASADLAMEKRRGSPDVPDSLPVLHPVPSRLTVDGEPLEIMDGLSGDVHTPSSAVLLIPTLRAVLVGDLAFSGIHPWLGDSDSTSRERWRAELRRIRALDPAIVVPGHQRDLSAPRTVELLDQMIAYLDAFDAAARTSANASEVVSRMTAAYPDRVLPVLMAAGARRHFAAR